MLDSCTELAETASSSRALLRWTVVLVFSEPPQRRVQFCPCTPAGGFGVCEWIKGQGESQHCSLLQGRFEFRSHS